MGWKARVSVVVLVILTGLPVSGTVCAFACQPGSQGAVRTAGHHGDTACADAQPASDTPQLHSLSGHDCRSHALTAQSPATFASDRASGTLNFFAAPAILEQANALGAMASRQPPRQSPPTATPPRRSIHPIVLRV